MGAINGVDEIGADDIQRKPGLVLYDNIRSGCGSQMTLMRQMLITSIALVVIGI